MDQKSAKYIEGLIGAIEAAKIRVYVIDDTDEDFAEDKNPAIVRIDKMNEEDGDLNMRRW